MSPLSSSNTRRPRMAASRATPAPFMPAPTTITSKACLSISWGMRDAIFYPFSALLPDSPPEIALHGISEGVSDRLLASVPSVSSRRTPVRTVRARTLWLVLGERGEERREPGVELFVDVVVDPVVEVRPLFVRLVAGPFT